MFALVTFVSLVSGQSNDCPKVWVVGGGFPAPGEPIPYRVIIEPAEKAVGLSYLWKVVTRDGELGMVRGQGTTQIEAPFTYDNLTAMVKVIGLPDGCPNEASETVGITPGHVADKLNESRGNVSKFPESMFNSVRLQIAQNPTALLFISVSAGKSGSARSKISLLNRRLALKANGLDGRTKIVTSNRKDDKITFWLVPAGANFPSY